MLTTTLAIALSLGLSASPPAKAAATPAPDPSWKGRNYDEPPPGTPADQALWKECYDLNVGLLIDQYASGRLEARARRDELVERLRDPARRGALPADAAEALATRLHQKWMADIEVTTSQWPVSKNRVCQYPIMNLEGVMFSPPAPSRESQLEDARRLVRDCVGKARKVHAAMEKANAELEAVIDEADRALPSAKPADAAKAAAAAQAATPSTK